MKHIWHKCPSHWQPFFSFSLFI